MFPRSTGERAPRGGLQSMREARKIATVVAFDRCEAEPLVEAM